MCNHTVWLSMINKCFISCYPVCKVVDNSTVWWRTQHLLRITNCLGLFVSLMPKVMCLKGSQKIYFTTWCTNTICCIFIVWRLSILQLEFFGGKTIFLTFWKKNIILTPYYKKEIISTWKLTKDYEKYFTNFAIILQCPYKIMATYEPFPKLFFAKYKWQAIIYSILFIAFLLAYYL